MARAARALAIGTATAYDWQRRGEFPVLMLRVGRRPCRRVRTADLVRYLEADGVHPSDHLPRARRCGRRWFYLRARLRQARAVRDARRAIEAGKAAKAQEEAQRPLMQRILTATPDPVRIRLFAWSPDPRICPYVRVARRGPRGRFERIDPAQQIMIVGLTGSGKSSTLRMLAAWALGNPRWSLEAWDGKWDASVRAYRGKSPVLDTMPDIEARLRDLIGREPPAGALMAEPPHLAIIMGESRLLTMLSAEGMRDLITVIQTGRDLGVHLWFGFQDPKTDSVPSEIRDQFTCKLVHQLHTREAAQVALKELVAAG
ncbi:hypothetical protein ACWEBX_01055 [Streptomyces sp. NPDC005070]